MSTIPTAGTVPAGTARRAAACAVLALLAGCDTVGTDATHVEASDDPWVEMLDAVNAVRAEGRTCGSEAYAPAGPLVWNNRLETAATRHTADMAARGAMDHRGSDGSDVGERVSRAGYSWRLVGENIARFQQTVPEVVADWAESPGHCRALMDPRYAEMGAAVQDRYWTQVFGLAR